MVNQEQYHLEKGVWTHNDFEIMGWHDSMIHGFGFVTTGEDTQTQLLLDIDYIFKWIDPKPPAEYFTFQVAPCTLVFHNISDLVIDIETGHLYQIELEIVDLNREIRSPGEPPFWTIETHRGNIEFEALGYTQYVRKYPIHIGGQQIPRSKRGGISFETTPVKN